MEYDPRDWYWIVAGDAQRVYSSHAGRFVPVGDPDYLSFLAQSGEATIIGSRRDLDDVLRRAGVRTTMPQVSFTWGRDLSTMLTEV